MKLGVFDSGIGGKAITSALQTTFPDATIVTINDSLNIPYGDKTPSEVVRLVVKAIQPLLSIRCDIIILACNTATVHTLEILRKKYPGQRFMGIEPMIQKAANLTKSHTIAVCATPSTLSSPRYLQLLKKYCKNITIIEPDCSTWAQMIENNKINSSLIYQTIKDACDSGADVIVLGCTHYHWIKDMVINICDDRAIIIEPSEIIGHQIKNLLKSS